MQNDSTNGIVQQPGSESERIIRKWLVIFGSLHQREITPLLIGAWCELLGDLRPEAIESGCIQTAKSCRFFPTPADIWTKLEEAAAKSLDLEAKRAWKDLLRHIEVYHGYPVLGEDPQPEPLLPPAIEQAVEAAGGISYIRDCSEEKIVWCRKDFLSAYKQFHETRSLEAAVGSSEAKRILAKDSGGTKPERKRLASTTPILRHKSQI